MYSAYFDISHTYIPQHGLQEQNPITTFTWFLNTILMWRVMMYGLGYVPSLIGMSYVLLALLHKHAPKSSTLGTFTPNFNLE